MVVQMSDSLADGCSATTLRAENSFGEIVDTSNLQEFKHRFYQKYSRDHQ